MELSFPELIFTGKTNYSGHSELTKITFKLPDPLQQVKTTLNRLSDPLDHEVNSQQRSGEDNTILQQPDSY